MKILRDLGASFSYFSILPIPHTDEPPGDDAIALLPIVGVVIGALSGAGAYGIFLLTHAQLAAAIAAWLLSIILSGAIHVDGFLDCCDGLFAMAPPQRRLEIMHDPHHGTYAIVGMAMISVLWLYALAQIPAALMPVLLPAIGMLARVAAFERVRGNAAVAGMALSILVVAFWLQAIHVVALFVVGIIVGWLVLAFARQRLGGTLNGDCYGAAIVVTEVTVLLAYPLAVLAVPR